MATSYCLSTMQKSSFQYVEVVSVYYFFTVWKSFRCVEKDDDMEKHSVTRWANGAVWYMYGEVYRSIDGLAV